MILELGRKASYLDHPHTLEHFKNEYYFPHVVIRQPRGVWESAGSPTIVDAARARVEKLRALPRRSVLTNAQQKELLAIEKRWTKELA